MITSQELRQKFLSFFVKKGHKIIPSASLIPENDPSVLFTTAGMHPLVPYLLGQSHPSGQRLCNCQKCLRTDDIDSVGDASHLTFFEMLGNWSLGDYFKEEAITWSFEFLTKELKIPLEKLAVSVFAGEPENKIPRDTESANIWQKLGVPKSRIAFLGREDNWWGPAGQTGPCGPDTEMFYWTGPEPTPEKFAPTDKRWVEIWNDVFMEYNKTASGKYEALKQKNVDTGMGLERTLAALNGKESVYETELFEPIINAILSLRGRTPHLMRGTDEAISKRITKHEIATSSLATLATPRNDNEIKAVRIIADHLKAATFILAEGVAPSNVERGYVLRRLIRRVIRYGKLLGIEKLFTADIAAAVIDIYQDVYPEVRKNQKFIFDELKREENKFRSLMSSGRFEKAVKILSTELSVQDYQLGRKIENIPDVSSGFVPGRITGKWLFDFYQTFGWYPEMVFEELEKRGRNLSKFEKEAVLGDFQSELQKHQELSRTAAAGKFRSGLADHSEKTVHYHTATHLLHAALRRVLGRAVKQKGSNITPERLRFDFSYAQKLTAAQVAEVEKIVNHKIKQGLAISCETLPYQKAIDSGALALFGSSPNTSFKDKYPEKVTVYSINDFSREICAGPHVKNTSQLGKFKIIKQESAGAGVRRIKAILE